MLKLELVNLYLKKNNILYEGKEIPADKIDDGKTPRSVRLRGVWLTNFLKNQHVGPSFSEIFIKTKVLLCAESTQRSVSLRGVRLLAVLAGAESLISPISPRKQMFKKNYFNLFIRRAGSSNERKIAKKSRDTATLKKWKKNSLNA